MGLAPDYFIFSWMGGPQAKTPAWPAYTRHGQAGGWYGQATPTPLEKRSGRVCEAVCSEMVYPVWETPPFPECDAKNDAINGWSFKNVTPILMSQGILKGK